jgi:hypothetical protein
VIQQIGEGKIYASFQKTLSHGWLIEAYAARSMAADALIPSNWISRSKRQLFDCMLSLFSAGEELRLQEINGNVIWTSNDKTRRGMAALVLFIASLLCVAIWECHAIIERMSGMNQSLS